jgi:hypothetical protein
LVLVLVGLGLKNVEIIKNTVNNSKSNQQPINLQQESNQQPINLQQQSNQHQSTEGWRR